MSLVSRGAHPIGWIACALFALTGCVQISGVVPARVDVAPESATFRAGAARIDITPTPGFAMGGHSRLGQVSRGFWHRLHARALYFEDASGRGVSLVAVDLWSVPEGLVAAVAERVNRAHDGELGGRTLGQEQIIISASHTHQSPALYSSDPFFSAFAGPRSGFDPDLHAFLARRIAAAIAEAVRTAEPAHVSMTGRRVSGLFRNRSMPAFRDNPEAGAVMEESGAEACVPSELFPDPDACRGVDTRVRALRIHRSRDGLLVGAGVFLAAHPEAIGNALAVYSADFFGALATGVERRRRTGNGGVEPVVAVFNGPEGDVSLRWTDQSRGDLQRLTKIGIDAVEALLDAEGSRVAGEIHRAFAPSERLSLRRVEREGRRARWTAALPMVGVGTGAGAEDGPSRIAPFLASEGTFGVSLPLQGSKIGALDVRLFGITIPPFWLTRLMMLVVSPPRSVPLSVVQLGDLRLATLPGEFTTVLGRRISARIGEAAGVGSDQVMLLGLGQGYAYYFATPEEYALQHYEGAGMLYGPWSGTWVAQRLGQLASQLPGDTHPTERAYRYRPWLAAALQPERSVQSALDPIPVDPSRDSGLRLALAPQPGDLPLDQLPSACVQIKARRLDAKDDRPPMPRVQIQSKSPVEWSDLRVDGARENTGSGRIVTVAGPAPDDSAHEDWCFFWLPPESVDSAVSYRFRYAFLDDDWKNSDAFRLGAFQR